LLVEPDAELVNALARALEQEGVTVRRCATHEAALAELDFHAPDVLIVNLQLPDGSGIDVLERLRKLERGDAAGSIAINDAGDFNAKVRAIRSGANAFFAKPLDLPSLVRRVIAFRARRRRAPARVLAVEDDPTQSLILRSVLGKAGYEIAVCSDPAQFENLLASFLPDLLLMDIHLDRGVGDISGFDLVRLLRQNDQFAHLPVIFVSGDRERDALMESAMSGGDTLVSKPVDWGVLLSQIASRLERASAVREVTDRDGLSGVLTRAAFHARVRERLSLQAEDARSIVVIIDLDHFKSVNDTHGHLAGDRVLASIGSCLRRGVRQADLVGRYGGEEFVLLLEEIALDDAVRLVERLLEDFSQIDQGGWRVTFSAGVATFDQSLEETLRRADAALYEAKRAGRARVVAA
jgi:diguanylate cyclase (GGDEF)-like protein